MILKFASLAQVITGIGTVSLAEVIAGIGTVSSAMTWVLASMIEGSQSIFSRRTRVRRISSRSLPKYLSVLKLIQNRSATLTNIKVDALPPVSICWCHVLNSLDISVHLLINGFTPHRKICKFKVPLTISLPQHHLSLVICGLLGQTMVTKQVNDVVRTVLILLSMVGNAVIGTMIGQRGAWKKDKWNSQHLDLDPDPFQSYQQWILKYCVWKLKSTCEPKNQHIAVYTRRVLTRPKWRGQGLRCCGNDTQSI